MMTSTRYSTGQSRMTTIITDTIEFTQLSRFNGNKNKWFLKLESECLNNTGGAVKPRANFMTSTQRAVIVRRLLSAVESGKRRMDCLAQVCCRLTQLSTQQKVSQKYRKQCLRSNVMTVLEKQSHDSAREAKSWQC